jgi:hypothetical protein
VRERERERERELKRADEDFEEHMDEVSLSHDA